VTAFADPGMDLFARTFLPAAADAGLDLPAISRHLPVFRYCLGADAVLLVTCCTRQDRPFAEYVLALTRHRLVILHESRVVHRVRLHLDAPLHELADVRWAADPTGTTLELSATAIDGVRERFTLRPRRPDALARLDTRLAAAFGAARPAGTDGRRLSGRPARPPAGLTA
jgi:hypothetical protein